MSVIDRLLPRRVDYVKARNEFLRLSHCHRCGACICYEHEAISDDTWEQHRVICEACMDTRFEAATPSSKKGVDDQLAGRPR